jgi:hypothetical protein
VNNIITGDETCLIFVCEWKEKFCLNKSMLEAVSDGQDLMHFKIQCENPPSPQECSEKEKSGEMGRKQFLLHEPPIHQLLCTQKAACQARCDSSENQLYFLDLSLPNLSILHSYCHENLKSYIALTA